MAKTAIIKAAHYDETEAALALDPIVIAMAHGLNGVPRSELVHIDEDGDEGGPRFEFMQSANSEYRERGGLGGGHIGAVASALLKLHNPDAPAAVKEAPAFLFAAYRDSVFAGSDEDRAMAHADIVTGEADFSAACKALAAYMVKEADYLAAIDREWAKDRITALYTAAGQVMSADETDFEELSASNMRLEFEADTLRFVIVRTAAR